ncbi:MAG: cadherin-like beta sandwich domain-containing protein [Verrucomicrobia bacterium]|nr:cadherin-like beta sandwich domain-containing protein [Verrucomicrobiota bacterium]
MDTGAAVAIGTQSATLLGKVNPNQGTTLVQFEYGATESYGRKTKTLGVGNGSTFADVALPAEDMAPGTTMHYRLLASNSLGMSAGEDRTFTTKSPAPTAVTGEAEILTTTKARLNGWARGNGNSANVFFDYGTDGVTFPNSISAQPATVTGNINTAVYAELPNLSQGVTYYFRVRAEGVNGTGTGDVRSLKPALLSGLIQRFPDQVTPNERQGSVTVTLHPGGIGSGWRFAGELSWRLSGIPATGLTSGDRVIEYRPVAGHVQPTSETVSVVSAPPGILLDRSYTASATTGTGDLTVTLKPESLADSSVPVANRPQWRLFGENDAQWKDSGTTISGLVAGNHLIECKAVPSRATPPASSAMIEENQSTTSTITYFLNQETIGAAPGVLTFQVVSASADQPYAYCGQIRSDVGGGSGFVVGPRVVATAGHVVFDDGALATATGLQWLFQRDRDVHEPRVLLPRGYYLMTGYAAQRAADNSPGTSTPQSQNLDAASLYFSEDAGRGGYSGYLASDSTSNEFILSSAIKTLVGYPLDGIAEQDRDKMHATPRSAVRFSQAFARTYTTSDIRSAGGNSGGPLCVQYENSNFYPAAIYLGGTAQTVVRAIDSDVVELFGFAETSARSGVGDAGGSLTTISRTPIATPALGALQVMIEPAAARNAGGGWRLRSQSSFRAGGYQENNLNPNIYSVEFATVAGYVPPSLHTVEIKGGELATFSFTYEKIILPPVINSPDSVTGVRGSTLAYQITALNSPDLFSLRGALPAGMSFEESNGLISGIPTEAGRFIVTAGANNSGGADSRMVTLTSLPDLNPQSLTIPYNQPMSYQIITSESGNGVVFAATNLPQGLSLNPVSGQVSGTPMVAGSFPIPISVTIRNATATSILTLHITGTPPVFTLQPVAARTIAYGGSTSLKVAAEGLPAPTFQWYQGESGVTDSPIPGATSAMFTTPSLTTPTKYWVRASSISGSTDSSTSAISLLPSTNANLAGLLLSSGTLSPTFNAGIASYAANVGNAVSTIQITPLVEVGQSTVRINGGPTAPGAPSIPLALATGPNLISVEVTAGDGTTKKTYLITVTRLAPASITTGGILNLTDISATIQGTVIPNGNATVFFQYGRTTNYGSTTPPQDVSGINPLVFQSVLKGLQGDTEYHFRSAVTTAAGTFFGEDAMFRTAVNSPLVATGDAVDVTRTDALLLGAVDTNNIATEVYFEYGPTTNYGFNTPHGTIPAGVGVVDISYPVTGVNASYHYRLVAINAAGMAFGDDVILGTGGGSKIDSSKPDAATGDSSDITTGSAILQGLVNPHNRTTMVSFEYGLTETYGSKTASRGVGNGNTGITVVQMADGLLPGTTYHYRVSAANSHGTTLGEDRTFTTAPLAPAALTGDAGALTATTARIHGTVKARGANTLVSFEYGTDGMNFPNRANADPANVTGDAEIPVSLEIANLDELVTYYYRIRASNSGGTTLGAIRTLRTGSLQGLVQDFTREVPINDRQGQLIVNILPTAIGGWRFIGDTSWRNSGEMVASLTTGEREIEFRPVAGYIQPQNELVGVVSGETTQVLERIYYDSAVPGTGALKVFLLPESITGTGVSLPSRAQWRIIGDSTWIDSGAERTGLTPGSYLVECKAVLGKNTPSPVNALVTQRATKTTSISYFPASAPSLNPPRPIPFSTVSTSENLPYGYVGQIRSGTGSYSGFVVKPRVVVTVAQAIFDDATLSATSGTQWLLQRDRGTYEPTPQTPRGYYLFSGYDAQRTAEASPGLLSAQSQDMNVAALYFAADAGRGGFSGFLASDTEPNEFLTSTSLKTLVGYPVNGVSTANQGRMHATTPATATMTLALGRTYQTSQIRGMGGMFGGPFCVQKDGGAFYPAGVFVGGTTQSLIRAIDGNMIDLFTRAEVSGNGGDNNTGGGITHSSFTTIGTASQPGALKITILPEAAISSGRWSISPETTLRTSGAQKGNLAAGTYVIKFNTVAGFQVPAQQTITISGGQLSNLTYTYESSTTPQESWRLTNFNSTANAGIAADDADPDGDGASNRDEYTAGTNPNYAADRFKVLTMTRTTSLFSVSVLGKKDRTYVLERTSNLKAGSWSAVKSIGPLTSDQPITLTDVAPPVVQGYYQVRVTSP